MSYKATGAQNGKTGMFTGFFTLKPRKSADNISVILVLPCALMGVNSAVSFFFFLAFGKMELVRTFRTAAIWNGLIVLALSYALLLYWYAPIWRFCRTFTPDAGGIVKERLNSIYRAIILFFAIILSVETAAHLAALALGCLSGEFVVYALCALVLSTLIQFCYALVFLDNILIKSTSVLLEKLYSREQLYVMREGFNISFSVKIGMLLLSTAVVPMAMMYVYLRRVGGLAGNDLIAVNNLLIVTVFTPMVLGYGVIYSMLQGPVNGLIAKMKRLSAGDYDVKTRIYFTDEIAHLKNSFNRLTDQLKEREYLRETFGKYVSIEIARQLLKTGKINLGGENISATVMFCDIRNFTALAERLSAGELIDFLNNYFAYVTPPIMANRGVINKFMGDAVMAVYTPALGSEAHADDAVLSAAAMAAALEKFNASGKMLRPVQFGIGIHTGLLVAGNVGTMARLEYTVIGDVVNAASRLESKTKDLSADILISGAVHDALNPRVKGLFGFESLGSMALKGKNETVPVYKVSLSEKK
ncbi:MAG: adenylate/guanylate cyclase domain-containing protein [Elusimicrobia bacterium]|nr:adenylate/guanylate cyclase domain-containing protein [Elusimicrobiota bacterium]